jgi:hypothetical protein
MDVDDQLVGVGWLQTSESPKLALCSSLGCRWRPHTPLISAQEVKHQAGVPAR